VNGYLFCFAILAYSLPRLWRRTFCTFPRRCPRDGGTVQAFLCPRHWPFPEDRNRTKEITSEEQKKSVLSSCSSSADAMKAGVRETRILRPQRLAPQALLPSPLLAPGAPTLIQHSALPPQPVPELTPLHRWWRGILVPPCCISRRPVGPGPSSCSCTYWLPS